MKKNIKRYQNGNLSISCKLKWTSILPFGFSMSFGGHQSIFKICVQPHSPHSVNSQGRFSTRWANTKASIHPWHRAGWNIYLTTAGAWGNTTRSGALWAKSDALRKIRPIDASLLNYSLRDWQLILFVQIYLKQLNKQKHAFMFNGARPSIIFKLMFHNYKFCAVQPNEKYWRFSSE